MSKCTGLVGDSNLEAAFSSKGLLELLFIPGGGQKAFFEALFRRSRRNSSASHLTAFFILEAAKVDLNFIRKRNLTLKLEGLEDGMVLKVFEAMAIFDFCQNEVTFIIVYFSLLATSSIVDSSSIGISTSFFALLLRQGLLDSHFLAFDGVVLGQHSVQRLHFFKTNKGKTT